MSRAQGRAQMRQYGFTLVELMIVVAIIGVLAVIAGGAYKKYSDSGRTAEAMAMIGEIRTKEEAYRAEFNNYLSTTTVGESDFYPSLTNNCPAGQSEPCAKPLTTRPASWTSLGVAPSKAQLYCGYVVVAGGASAWGLAGTDGKNAYNNVVPTQPWFYVRAQCDNDRKQAANTTFVAANNTTTVVTLNEHK